MGSVLKGGAIGSACKSTDHYNGGPLGAFTAFARILKPTELFIHAADAARAGFHP
jgi:hypothetical protein